MRLFSQKGMTLVELITTIAILGIICTPISMFLISMYKSAEMGNQYLNAENVSRQIISNIKTDLGMYEGEETTVLAESLTIGPSKLGGADVYKVNYYRTGNGLYRKLIENGLEHESQLILSSDTGSIRFKDITFSQKNDVIYIDLTITYGVLAGEEGKDFSVSGSYRRKILPTP